MARRPHGLIPRVPDHGAPALSAEVALPKLEAGLARRLEQQRQQGPLVGEAAGVEGVWQGKHQGDIGPRQQRSCAGLAPLDLHKRLALGAVAMAAGVIRVPLNPTGRTTCGVPAAWRGTAGCEVPYPLLRRGWHRMVTAVWLAVEAEDIGAFPRWGAGRAHLYAWWAGGGRRWHGVTPAWAGVDPRRAGGRTGCGSSPEAAG
jgi:hypothetical protein